MELCKRKLLVSEENGITTVQVSMDIVYEYVESFKESFSKGLQTVKEIAEGI